jgi:hypothetical protein
VLYNAPGLAFHKVARFVIQALNHHVSWLLDCELHILSFEFGLLHFRSFLTHPVKLQQSHALRYIYCMHMHMMNIMDA